MSNKSLGNFGKQGKLIARMKSDSSDEVYDIREVDKGLTCECMGFVTSKRRPKSCRHIRRLFIMTILKGVHFSQYEKINFLHEAKEIERLFKKEV